jgi:uncharacterized protein
MNDKYFIKIAKDLNLQLKQVKEVYKLVTEEDATLPFIARYRKERTGNLDDLNIKDILDKINYFKELDDRKKTILETIKSQDKLTETLEKTINDIFDKIELEDLYLPYKPKKKNKSSLARELGLEYISDNILEQKNFDLDLEIKKFINPDNLKTYEDVEMNIIYILSDNISSTPKIISNLRDYYLKNAIIATKLKRGVLEDDAEKYKDYFALKELVKKIPSHRFLAINRGEDEGFISIKYEIDEDIVKEKITKLVVNQNKKVFEILKNAIEYSFKEQIHTQMSSFLKKHLKEKSDLEAIDIFKKNLSDILLSPPLPDKTIMGIDPGFRTGAKVVVIDKQGNFKEYANIFAVEPFKKTEEAEYILLNLIKKYNVEAIAIGNGTASRETNEFVKDIVKDKDIIISTVNESGASIYSASENARLEFPDLDVTVRGAISIARRLSDPLSELVKIESKSIGVGQYQHDINQKLLNESLNFVVSSIVNKIGVNINNASKDLLSYVSGLSKKNVESIIEYRKEYKKFKTRDEIKKVKGIGSKIYLQSTGFLMIEDGLNILDGTRVHPESYEVALNIINKLNYKKEDFFNLEQSKKKELLNSLNINDFVKEFNTDIYTVKDIIDELITPLRDPRESFQYAKFNDKIKNIEDLNIGMILEGVVNNLTKFGAFVDIGLHESGLIHVSEISDKFIADINKVLKLGQIVTVKVVLIDVKRKRIGLSIKQA